MDSTDAASRFRAVRSLGVAIEDDPDPMVQQQLARLKLFDRELGATGRRVLDWGSGTGFNCHWLARHSAPEEVLGFDVSEGAVAIARDQFPGIAFEVADACDPAMSLRPGHWDRILSCEVLEHVPDMGAFLANLRRHLADDGAAFLSTPNREVFSLGHEPSPVNQEHVKELDHGEFVEILRPHFSRVEVLGQRFRDPAKLEAWKEDVREKIDLCRRGLRWQRKASLRERLRRIPLVEQAYRVPALRSAWRTFRWKAVAGVEARIHSARRPYGHEDFEFVAGDLRDAIWFCAVLRP